MNWCPKVGDGTVIPEWVDWLDRCIVGRRINFRGPPPLKRNTGKIPWEHITEGASIIFPNWASSITIAEFATSWSNRGDRRQMGSVEKWSESFLARFQKFCSLISSNPGWTWPWSPRALIPTPSSLYPTSLVERAINSWTRDSTWKLAIASLLSNNLIYFQQIIWLNILKIERFGWFDWCLIIWSWRFKFSFKLNYVRIFKVTITLILRGSFFSFIY